MSARALVRGVAVCVCSSTFQCLCKCLADVHMCLRTNKPQTYICMCVPPHILTNKCGKLNPTRTYAYTQAFHHTHTRTSQTNKHTQPRTCTHVHIWSRTQNNFVSCRGMYCATGCSFVCFMLCPRCRLICIECVVHAPKGLGNLAHG